MPTPSIKRARLANTGILLAFLFSIAIASEFDDARKAFRAGRCQKAIRLARQVISESRFAPAQVKEDRTTRLRQWEGTWADCKEQLPPEYQSQLSRYNEEYQRVLALRKGAAKTDEACDLLRRAALFTNQVKQQTSECPCRDMTRVVENLLRKVMVLCPKPCGEIDKEVEDILKGVLLLSGNIKLSTKLLKEKKVSSFRKRIRGYRGQLLRDMDKADSLREKGEYCLGRKGNRNLGLIVGTTQSLAKGLKHIDQMCGFVQSLHGRIQRQARRDKAFRDSVDLFFKQVNQVVDQWLVVNAPGDREKMLTLEKGTSQKMHDMFFKLAKIDLERSLLLLERPTWEKQREIVRLRAMQFEGDLTPEEQRQLLDLRNQVVTRIYYSIPWPVRFWDEQRTAALIALALGAILVIAVVSILVFRIRARVKRRRVLAQASPTTPPPPVPPEHRVEDTKS